MPELAYQSTEAAGLDLVLDRYEDDPRRGWQTGDLILKCDASVQIATGVKIAIPPGCAGRLIMRSGLGIKRGLVVHAGLIDSDYRGEFFRASPTTVPTPS